MIDPQITILMSVYNDEKYLPMALDSIQGQSFDLWELILIDDASTDNSASIARAYSNQDKRIRLIEREYRQGLARNLNDGIVRAKGGIIARMDSDDISHKDRLRSQFNIMHENQDVGIIGSSAIKIDANGALCGHLRVPSCDVEIKANLLLGNNPFVHSSVMIRKKVLKRFLYFDNNLPAQDIELWSRLLPHTRAMNIESPLIFYRSHGSSTSALKRRTQDTICALSQHKFYTSLLSDGAFQFKDFKNMKVHFNNEFCTRSNVNIKTDASLAALHLADHIHYHLNNEFADILKIIVVRRCIRIGLAQKTLRMKIKFFEDTCRGVLPSLGFVILLAVRRKIFKVRNWFVGICSRFVPK